MGDSTEKKTGHGCMYYIVRFAGILIALNFLFWLLSMGFHLVYPPTPLTQAFIPFQNSYLAFTDSFITSEFGTSEFTNDPGPLSRFIFSGVLIVVAMVLLIVVMAIIPALNRLAKYISWVFLTLIVLALIHATFIPGTRTLINPSARQLEVVNFSWGFLPEKKIIPFAAIQNFDYEVREYWDQDHNYTLYAQLLAGVNGEKIFIGENEIGTHGGAQADHDAWKMPDERRAEIEKALQALRDLTGMKGN